MEVPKSHSQIQSKMVVENVLGMKSGDGDSSYVKNSSFQLKLIETLKPILESSIYENMKLEFKRGDIFRIADFGCGTVRNTLVVADIIVRAMQCSLGKQDIPECQVFFSDLPSNDFNSLFRMLPPLPDVNNELPARSYFAAAVCGSHFRRLFPAKSLHFCHSSSNLRWISQIPESVRQRSPRVYVSSDCEEEVGTAYFQQFNTDFTAFLTAQAREIVHGGCMFISLMGRNPGTQIMEEQGPLGYIARYLEYAFDELVNEDIIEREKWDSFYTPWFGPSLEEVESIVKSEGSFEIGNIRMVGGILPYSMAQVNRGEEEMFGKSVVNFFRALFETIIEAHLGSARLTNEFFLRIEKRFCTQFEEYVHKEVEIIGTLLIKKEDHNTL